MTPNKPRDPSNGSGDSAQDIPILQPHKPEPHSHLEIVWSSPVFTVPEVLGASPSAADSMLDSADRSRTIHAFESDFLDGALLSWREEDEGQGPTLEMLTSIPNAEAKTGAGASKERIHTIASGLQSDPGAPRVRLQRIDTDSSGSAAAGDAVPEDPEPKGSADADTDSGPGGFTDPHRGWRPTGVVFFETLSTPPRGIVYSSCKLVPQPKPGPTSAETHLIPIPDFSPKDSDRQDASHAFPEPALAAKPMFDFPKHVPAAASEDTAETPRFGTRTVRRGGFFRSVFKLLVLLIALVGVAVVVMLALYFNYAKTRLYENKLGGQMITMAIHPGENFKQVINRLENQELLRGFMGLDDRYLMRYLAYTYDNANLIKPGVYRVDSGLSLKEVYDRMIRGSQDFKITIPEGKTAGEIAADVKKRYDTFDDVHFKELVNSPKFIAKMGIAAPSLEGYLYPSTYYFGPGMKEEELIKLMVGTFKSNVKEKLQDYEATATLPLHDHVIIASLIEREARMDEDRPLIASVIYNRLIKGMPLQIDATVNFALNDWRRLTYADYKFEHPYNTYRFKGLPPGPITSPRIDSLLATFQAPETEYLYYVHKGDGRHAFAATYEEHLANVGRYIKERAEPSMGNSPLESQDDPTSAASVAGAAKDVDVVSPEKTSSDPEKQPGRS